MKKLVTITRYFSVKISILIGILIAVYSISIEKVYEWGVLDTTHYYMSLEADIVWHSIEATGKVPDVPNSYTHYYLSQKDLPEHLENIFPREHHQDGVLLVEEEGGVAYLLLPNFSKNSLNFFYVLHTYNKADDSYSVLMDIPELQFLLGLFILLLLFLLVKHLAWSIIAPMRQMEDWADSIANNFDKSEGLELPNLKFIELKRVADELEKSMTKIKQVNQREVGFLRCLSHELRTPLAVTKAALELLQNSRSELNQKTLIKLDRIGRSNDNMLNTTQSLLWLWKQENTSQQSETINLYELVNEKIDNNQYLLKHKVVKLENIIPKELTIQTDRGLLSIVVNNLVRNAFQYSATGKSDVNELNEVGGAIELSMKGSELVVKNTVSNDTLEFTEKYFESDINKNNFMDMGMDMDMDTDTDTDTDYGYGVGIYLVEKICTEKGWHCRIENTELYFQVTINFG